MRIAVLTASFLPKVGGAQVFSYNIARQFAADGHQVCVYVPADNYEALGARFRGLLHPLPRRFYGLVRRVPFVGIRMARQYLIREQRREGYDAWLVVVTFPSGYVATCLKGRVPIVLRASGEDIQKDPALDYGLRLEPREEARIARTVNSYDRLVALTESVRTDFLDLGVSDDIIQTVPNGVDLDRFERTKDRSQIRSELGWPTDRQVILTTGRNHRKKGFDQIPRVAESLRDRGLRFRWYVVGLGADRLDGEIRSRGLSDLVQTVCEVGVDRSHATEWRFPDSRLVAMYQAADVYAFPSLLETFGMVQLEAMAAGAAVVSTDAPGCRDVVFHEQNGLSSRAGDADSFAEQLGRMLLDGKLRESLAVKAMAFVEEYGWPVVAKRYEEMFASLIENGRGDGRGR